MFAPEGITKPK